MGIFISPNEPYLKMFLCESIRYSFSINGYIDYRTSVSYQNYTTINEKRLTNRDFMKHNVPNCLEGFGYE